MAGVPPSYPYMPPPGLGFNPGPGGQEEESESSDWGADGEANQAVFVGQSNEP